MRNPFKNLSLFEWCLWIGSLLAVILCFFFSESRDILSAAGSLIGVTALIFTAKGDIWGQILIIVFAVFYGIVSFSRQYYGEMITYLGMSAPMAVVALVAWIRHPFKGNKAEVEVKHLSVKTVALTFILAGIVTFIFYYILRALGTAELPLSTLSVTTSFLAASLTFLRSPYYALGYAANDLVLIGLWVLAGNIAMIICFIVFFVNDMYGFFNWIRMQKRQSDT